MKKRENVGQEGWRKKLSHVLHGLILVGALGAYFFSPDASFKIWYSEFFPPLLLNASINFFVCRVFAKMNIWFAMACAFLLSGKEFYHDWPNGEYAAVFMYTGLCGSIAGILSALTAQMKKEIIGDGKRDEDMDSKDTLDA